MMKIQPYYSPISKAGAWGAGVMTWNSAVTLAKDQGAIQHKSTYGIGTSELNFMGAQDAFIAGALFIAFAALARGIYLYSEQQKRDARRYFALAGSMLVAAGSYALIAGLHHLAIPGSQLGHFGQSATANKTLFSVIYSVLISIGAVLVGTGYKMSTSNTVKHHVNGDGADISAPINANKSKTGGESVDL